MARSSKSFTTPQAAQAKKPQGEQKESTQGKDYAYSVYGVSVEDFGKNPVFTVYNEDPGWDTEEYDEDDEENKDITEVYDPKELLDWQEYDGQYDKRMRHLRALYKHIVKISKGQEKPKSKSESESESESGSDESDQEEPVYGPEARPMLAKKSMPGKAPPPDSDSDITDEHGSTDPTGGRKRASIASPRKLNDAEQRKFEEERSGCKRVFQLGRTNSALWWDDVAAQGLQTLADYRAVSRDELEQILAAAKIRVAEQNGFRAFHDWATTAPRTATIRNFPIKEFWDRINMIVRRRTAMARAEIKPYIAYPEKFSGDQKQWKATRRAVEAYVQEIHPDYAILMYHNVERYRD